MKPQVIRFSGSMFDGTAKAETLRGGPVDLAKLGKISVRRSSLIEFDEEAQKYYVEFLEPSLLFLNEKMKSELYDTYELAVEREVEIINEYRRQGVV